MSDPHDCQHPDSLEALLRDSVPCELEADRLERLSQQWSKINRSRKRNRNLTLSAAVVLCVGGVTGYQHWNGVRQSPQLAEESSEGARKAPLGQAIAADVDPKASLQIDSSDAVNCLVTVAFERRIELARRIERFSADVGEPEIKTESSPDESLKLAIASVAAGASVDDELMRLEEAMSAEQISSKLIAWIDQPGAGETGLDAQAMWKFVTATATPSSLAELERLRRHSAWKDRAERLMATLVDSSTLLQAAWRETSFKSRRILAAELLSRGDMASVRAYLTLVNHPQVSAAALNAVADVSEVPVRELMSCLDARQREVRISAALALGRINRDDVVLELINRASYPSTRKVALVALVSSDHPNAKQYVFQAASDVRQVASVQAARHLVHLFATNS